MKTSNNRIEEISAEWEVLEKKANELIKNLKKELRKVLKLIH